MAVSMPSWKSTTMHSRSNDVCVSLVPHSDIKFQSNAMQGIRHLSPTSTTYNVVTWAISSTHLTAA